VPVAIRLETLMMLARARTAGDRSWDGVSRFDSYTI
jgi:hypothetical protein